MTWQRFARRTHAPLSARLLQEAQRAAYFESTVGIPAGLRNHVWLRDTIYVPAAEIRAQRNAVEAAIGNDEWSFLESFVTLCRIAMAELATVAGSVASSHRNAARPDGLKELFDTWIEAYRTAMAFVPVFRILDEVLAARLADRGLDHRAGASGHITEEARERSALSEIVARLREIGDTRAESDEAAELFDRHVEEFGWLRTRWYLGEPFSVHDVRGRALSLLSARERTLVARRRPPPPADDHERLIGELAFLRSSRAESINKAIWTARPFFTAIATHLGILYEDVVYLLHQEIGAALESGNVPHDLIAMRRQAFGTVLLEDRFRDLAGDVEVDAFSAEFDFDSPADSRTGNAEDVLRGVVASPGRASGAVRLVRSEADDARVAEGDVLVTTMTFPSLVGAMQRAAAIVTDDGGLLSHAAVTARELGKPCLIGTGVATAVLIDGEMVEVDCDAGIVRRLDRPAKKMRQHRSTPCAKHSSSSIS
jgi:phosphohistidine swiveling domain-containing protein